MKKWHEDILTDGSLNLNQNGKETCNIKGT